MKMTSKLMVIVMSLAFSLFVSGPAFSTMSCDGSIMHMSIEHGSLGEDVSHHQKMNMDECYLSVDCHSLTSMTVQTRFYKIEPLVVSKIVWNVHQIVGDHAQIPELFHQFRLQQGPPLLASSSYKAYLARTTRQNI